MHNHNHDLIAALAEDLLARELAEAAEADISACAECSAELVEQRRARQALASLGPAALSSEESAILRSAVAGAVGIVESVAASSRRRPRRNFWPAIAAAAGLAGVLTIVPVLGLIDGGSDDTGTASQTVAAAEIAEPAEAPALDEGARNGADDTADLEEMALSVAPEAGAEEPDQGMTTMAADTTGAPTTTPAPPGDVLSVTGTEQLNVLFEAGPKDRYFTFAAQAERASLLCNAEAAEEVGDDSLYIDAAVTLDDGRPVVLYVDLEWTLLVAFDVDDCSVALTIP